MSVEPTTFLVIAVVIITFLGAAYGLRTRKGSGITDHPDERSEDPARDPDASDVGEVPETERPDTTILDQRGKK